MDAEKSDKFAKWRKWREKVRASLDKSHGKLYKVKNSGTPRNRKAIEEQIAVIKVCLTDAFNSMLTIPYTDLIRCFCDNFSFFFLR
jgi:hypothetical protein